MTQTMPIHALVGFLERHDPAAIAGLRSSYPKARFQSDLELGDQEATAPSDALLAIAKAVLGRANGSVDSMRALVQARLRTFGRLSMVGNLLGAGASIGLVASISNDLKQFEMATAISAFVGSAISMVSQQVGGSLHGGLSVNDAYSKLVQISRELAEVNGQFEMYQVVTTGAVNIEDVIRRANGAVSELLALEMSLGILPTKK